MASASREQDALRSLADHGEHALALVLTPEDEVGAAVVRAAAVTDGLVTKQVCAPHGGARLYEAAIESYISITGQARGQARLRNPDASDRVKRGL